MTASSTPAYCIAPFNTLVRDATPFLSRPPAPHRPAAEWAAYYFNTSINAVLARHALAEIALNSLGGLDGKGDIVALAGRHMATPPPSTLVIEAYVSAFLFGAWATIESSTFAANALGYATFDGFKPLDKDDELRSVSPNHVLGYPGGKRPPLAVYATHLPRFNAAMLAHRGTLVVLQEQHNTSKHRGSTTGKGNVDLSGFPEALHPFVFQRLTWTNIELRGSPQKTIARHDPHAPTVPLNDVERDWRRALYDIGVALGEEIAARA